VLVSAANRHDSLFVEPILDTMPANKRGGRGHPRRRPVKLEGDKGYDNPRVRRYLRRGGITARIARWSRACKPSPLMPGAQGAYELVSPAPSPPHSTRGQSPAVSATVSS
jgi:hypothetical protein